MMIKYFIILFYFLLSSLSSADSVFLLLKKGGNYGGQISVTEMPDLKTCQALKNIILENENKSQLFLFYVGACVTITEKDKNKQEIENE